MHSCLPCQAKNRDSSARLLSRLTCRRVSACGNASCPEFSAEVVASDVQLHSTLYVPNDPNSKADLADLLEAYQMPRPVTDFKCEVCQQFKACTTQTILEEAGDLLTLAILRGGPIENDRAQRNCSQVHCPPELRVRCCSYSLVGLVEHTGGEIACADNGHFVAWLCHEGGWFRMDDSQASVQMWLHSEVPSNTVLAVYCKVEAEVCTDDLESCCGPEVEQATPVLPGGSLKISFASEAVLKPSVDAHAVFDALAAKFYTELISARSVESVLKSFPVVLKCWDSLNLETSLECLRESLFEVKKASLNAHAEVDVFQPVWRTVPLQLALVFETLARVVSLPFSMLWDSFKVILSSCLHKDMGVTWGEYDLRHRYWAVVTSDPGAGKSPALQLMMSCLLEAMADPADRDLFPGAPEDNFHIVHDSTHAAFAARLNRANGYALLASPEAAGTLCPKFPVSGEFNKGGYVDFERCLEGASGGAIHWDTQESVLNRAKNARQLEQASEKGVHHDSTNFAFVLFQQVSMLQSWWAQGEAKWKKGLTNRFLFSTGRRPTEVPAFAGTKAKLTSYLGRLLRSFCRHLGQAKTFVHPWKLTAPVHEAFLEARAIATELEQETIFNDGGSLHSMLSKVSPWLCHEAFMNEVLDRLGTALVNHVKPVLEDRQIGIQSAKLALEFLHLRLAPILVVEPTCILLCVCTVCISCS